MSKIKNGRLDQYGHERFVRLTLARIRKKYGNERVNSGATWQVSSDMSTSTLSSVMLLISRQWVTCTHRPRYVTVSRPCQCQDILILQCYYTADTGWQNSGITSHFAPLDCADLGPSFAEFATVSLHLKIRGICNLHRPEWPNGSVQYSQVSECVGFNVPLDT